MSTPHISISGSPTLFHRHMVKNVVEWCFKKGIVVPNHGIDSIKIEICTHDKHDCCGSCTPRGERHGLPPSKYDITLASDQSFRDIVATIVHEMVHVNQWVTGEWEEDGEKEAERLQYKYADMFWKESNNERQ